MSEQSVLWLLNIFITIIVALIGVILRVMWSKLLAIEQNAQNTSLATFLGRYDATEKAMDDWKDVVITRLNDKRATLKDHEHRITKLERNGHA